MQLNTFDFLTPYTYLCDREAVEKAIFIRVSEYTYDDTE